MAAGAPGLQRGTAAPPGLGLAWPAVFRPPAPAPAPTPTGGSARA
jgi:hypothetical protein